MSWQAYVDSSLLGTGHLDKAAILAGDGTSTWAISAGFQISPEEGKTIAKALGGDRDAVFADGFHVGGERYVVTRAEDRSLYGRQGKDGVAIVKTNQAIIVGHYGPQHQAGNAANVVEKLADYLIGLGY
ncbi:hypothetical protein SAPIO_CDS7184 [Scedosporium apiospermum]|uniref:Profilin n=1 Tax=Pseudallescheria apiosperma TaxID=563466 RepID=A0A084G1A7_PSEDA|nr:uncharacterized protein SAPIO_CDS7184 [Scedosporium apiospermum]KEZ41119.1 hypothetical protein SAPIO_CDS7184 [Scedosporium apiospermum]